VVLVVVLAAADVVVFVVAAVVVVVVVAVAVAAAVVVSAAVLLVVLVAVAESCLRVGWCRVITQQHKPLRSGKPPCRSKCRDFRDIFVFSIPENTKVISHYFFVITSEPPPKKVRRCEDHESSHWIRTSLSTEYLRYRRCSSMLTY
jgi:hypothetical protein